MTDAKPTILALDFDGIICDGLIEYFQTSWRAYCEIWLPPDTTPPAGLAESFYRLRPVIETGWEMPLVLRSLLTGTPESEILAHWGEIAQQLVASEKLVPAEVGARVDGVRDRWIAADLDNWLSLHRFYPGVIEWLTQVLQSPVYTYIISTKEDRFILQLLQQQGVEITKEQVFGKEHRQPKGQILRTLIRQYLLDYGEQPSVWFVEDRLKTLQNLETQPDLDSVELFLGDWGYNTEGDRAAARESGRIHLISLSQFVGDFDTWI